MKSIFFALTLLMLSAVADAQTVQNRIATITWQAPTTCEGGAPITTCPITGYIIEKQNGANWVPIGTTAPNVRQFVEQNLALGSHSWRVLANSDSGPSLPSAVATRAIALPGTPGGVQVVITVNVTITP